MLSETSAHPLTWLPALRKLSLLDASGNR